MASENHKKAQSREEMRFEREAKALQKNLEKRQFVNGWDRNADQYADVIRH